MGSQKSMVWDYSIISLDTWQHCVLDWRRFVNLAVFGYGSYTDRTSLRWAQGSLSQKRYYHVYSTCNFPKDYETHLLQHRYAVEGLTR